MIKLDNQMKKEISSLKDNTPKKTIHIELGPACNNNCIFCREDREARAIRESLHINYYKDILLRSHKKFKTVTFTSGEPTLNKNLLPLIEYAKHLRYDEISLITNGRMLSYKNFCLSLIKKGITSIGISVHGHNASLHDSLTRSPGSFNQTTKGLLNIKNLREIHPLKKFTIHTTITKLNYKYLDQMYDFFIKFEPDELIFNMFHPGFKTRDKFDLLMPRYSDVAKILKKMYDKNKRKFILIDFPPCTVKNILSQLGNIEDSHLVKEPINKLSKKIEFKRESLKGKIKFKKCKNCKLTIFCQGIFPPYANKIGESEFKPIK